MKRSYSSISPIRYGRNGPSPKRKLEEDDEVKYSSYRHFSTIHKCETRPKTEYRHAPTATVAAVDKVTFKRIIDLKTVRESPSVSYNKVTLKPAVTLPDREFQAPSHFKMEIDKLRSGMISPKGLKKDVNPFYKGFAPAKVVAAALAAAAKNVKPYDRNDNEEDFPNVSVSHRPEPVANAPNGKYSWMDCVYSPKLLNGADAKVSFVWALNKFQVFASEDENTILEFQKKVMDYLKTHKPMMTRPPVLDEIVLGFYQGEYYRGRVTEVKDGSVKILFLDFGDATYNTFEQLMEPNDEIMKHPIYTVTIALVGVPIEIPKLKCPTHLSNHICGPLRLELFEELKIRPNSEYPGKLWVSDFVHLNEMIISTIYDNKFRDY